MAKKPVAPIVAGAGLLAAIFTKLDKAVQERGGTPEQVHFLATDAGDNMIGQIADIITGQSQLKENWLLNLDYGQSVEEMVKAGRYDYVNDYITGENFPVESGLAQVEAIMVHPNRFMSSEDVISLLDRKGLRPATMVELLAFGAQHPDAQRRFPIVALGSVWTISDGNRHVGCLWEDPGDRGLHLYWFDADWAAPYRFLAVRK